jgi:ABC-type cobalt transport system substrate-binding protein
MFIIIIIIIIIITIELSFGGSSPYASTDKTDNKNIHKLNKTKTQYKQYKTQ